MMFFLMQFGKPWVWRTCRRSTVFTALSLDLLWISACTLPLASTNPGLFLVSPRPDLERIHRHHSELDCICRLVPILPF
jgi:hypothetical protein